MSLIKIEKNYTKQFFLKIYNLDTNFNRQCKRIHLTINRYYIILSMSLIIALIINIFFKKITVIKLFILNFF